MTARLHACVPAAGALLAAALLLASAALAQGKPSGFTVRITEPANEEYVYGKVRIAAEVRSAEEPRGLRVEFSVAGKLVFIDREEPWECYHDFGDQSRSWVVEAKAVTDDGLAASHTVVTRRLDIHYREEVDRVLVTLSVTDKDNAFVEGLTAGDFSVVEDGAPQEILEFAVERRPITLGVLIDTSGSMKEEIGQVQAAAKDFVTTLRPEDRAFVVDFDENVFLLRDFTSDHGELQAALEGTDAEGGTSLYDALYVSYRKMRPVEGRKAIAMLTDGDDTNSSFSFKRVVELTRTHDVIVYSIGLGSTIVERSMRNSLKQLSDDSGGRAFFPRTAADLADVYEQIAADLRSQYYVTYRSTNRQFDGKWRKIEVACSREDTNVHTRSGYYGVKR